MGKRLITILLVLLTIGVQVFAQSAVSGKVTDKTGEPLVGAGVLVKGTTSGTTTDLDGKFSLQGLKQNAVLAFSSIGYETQEVTVGNQTVINVTLNEEAEFLNDVVVVAYGTGKKRDLTARCPQSRATTSRHRACLQSPALLRVPLLVSSCLQLTVSLVSTWPSVSVEPPQPQMVPRWRSW